MKIMNLLLVTLRLMFGTILIALNDPWIWCRATSFTRLFADHPIVLKARLWISRPRSN